MVRLSAVGGFTVIDNDNQLNIISQSANEIIFGPRLPSIPAGTGTFQIISNNLVDELTVQVDGDTRGPIMVGIASTATDVVLDLDTDDDGIFDHLDVDSDNGGVPDNIEAQNGVPFIAPSGIDSDGDGLDDAYD